MAMKRVSSSGNVPFCGMMARLNLSVVFRERDFKSLIEEVLVLHKAFNDVQTQIPNAPAKPVDANPNSLIEEALVCAFVTLAASETDLDTFLPNWAKTLSKLSGDIENRIRLILNSDRADVYRIYQDTTKGRLVRMIAALRMAIDTEAELHPMFLGQASLVGGLVSGGFKEEVSGAMGTIVKRTWIKRLNFPAEFPTPRITIRPIQKACVESVSGFKLAARILLQAKFAIPSLRLSPETIQQLETLAR